MVLVCHMRLKQQSKKYLNVTAKRTKKRRKLEWQLRSFLPYKQAQLSLNEITKLELQLRSFVRYTQA